MQLDFVARHSDAIASAAAMCSSLLTSSLGSRARALAMAVGSAIRLPS